MKTTETTPKQKTKSKSIEVKFKLDEGAIKPEYAHPGDLGMDIYALSVEYDESEDNYIYHTGVHVETKPGVGIFACARSSNCATSCYLPNGIGVIDSATYRGEILFKFKNRTSTQSVIKDIVDRVYYDLPWWMRLFTRYKELYTEVQQKFDPLQMAPYQPGDKIGQLIVLEFPSVRCKCVENLTETKRGNGGFGSTNKKTQKINE